MQPIRSAASKTGPDAPTEEALVAGARSHDEQAARENLPPSLEDSERAQAMDAAVSELESAISALEDFDADEIGTQLDTASE